MFDFQRLPWRRTRPFRLVSRHNSGVFVVAGAKGLWRAVAVTVGAAYSLKN
jgi:hypothetical protein